MTTQQIRYFLETASCLSFSEAARRLFVTQSGLSKQIASLEAELGLQLFLRNSRSLSLTASGEFLHRELGMLDASLERIVEQAQRLKRGEEGRLVCSILDLTDCEPVIFPMLRQFRAAYPKIDIDVSFLGFRELKERLESGHTDVAFDIFLEMASITDVDYMPLYLAPSSVLLPKGHRLAKLDKIALGQLKEESFVVLEDKAGAGQTRAVIDRCAEEGFHPTISRYASNNTSMLYYVKEGYGVSLVNGPVSVPNWCDVVCVSLQEQMPDRENHLVLAWPKKLSGDSTTRNPSIRIFKKFVENYVQGRCL